MRYQITSFQHLKTQLVGFVFDPSKNWSEYPCLLWDRSLTGDGYGNLAADGKVRKSHQVAYELTRGPVPEGLELDHLCRVRACFHPAHLEAVTHAENVSRSPLHGVHLGRMNAIKTHCPQGHPYDSKNTKIARNGCRECAICRRTRNLARYHELRKQGYRWRGNKLVKVLECGGPA
jgi:hypothetical protein